MAEHRTAIFMKDGIIGAISIYLNERGAMISSYDPRPLQKIYREAHSDTLAAIDEYTNSVETTKKRGWTIGFNGKPNHG